jgi:ABC-type Mn2+/Zn2+ transport system ATPase subunit
MYEFELNDPHFLPHCGCEIRFNIDAGQALIIVGDNGIGKTTLGRRFIEKFGNAHLGVIEQKPLDYFYDYTLKQIQGMLPGIESYWEDFDLLKKADRRLSMLSGGESQSLKIASALASEKFCYVMDEPSQSLDREKKITLSEKISKLLQQGKSFLIIEHDLEWLPKNISVIQLGKVQETIKVVKTWTT